MASIGITTSIHRACTKQPSTQARHPRSFIKNQTTNVVIPNVRLPDKSPLVTSGNTKEHRDETVNSKNSDEQSRPRFSDARWKNGTWDLNMFVKQGRMDWDSVIVAEAGRRKYLEMHPEASTNDEPVEFRSSIIPWWAWIVHSHLPEAELLNGRAAMVGFFMAYLVDALTGLDLVGQNVLLFRRKEDVENIRKIADEATFYDKQWQASWQNHDSMKERTSKNDNSTS
ncbi:hypothetical protein ACS0TY_001215 [Phlomoides rotata]